MDQHLFRVILIFALSCSFTLAHGFELSVAKDSVITDVKSGKKTPVKAGESTSLNERNPLWVETEGHVPVLVYPLNSETGAVAIKSLPMEKVVRDNVENKVDFELSSVLLQIGEVQSLLSRNNLSAAVQRISELKAKFPKVRYLDFLEASAFFLSGDKERALSSLEAGLKVHPDYEPGISMYKAIGGREESILRRPAQVTNSSGVQQ